MKKQQEGTGKIKRRFESGRWCERVHVLVRVCACSRGSVCKREREGDSTCVYVGVSVCM